MTGELRYEWRRITTVRSPWICLALAFLAGVAITWLSVGGQANRQGLLSRGEWVQSLLFPLAIANVLALVTAAQAIGQEYRFGMIRLTLTAFPRRLPLLGAKGLVVAGWCVGIFLASTVGSWIVLVLHGMPSPSGGLAGGSVGLAARAVLVLLGWAAFGFGIATITRLTPLGITLPLVWGLVVEGLVLALAVYVAGWGWVDDVLPFKGASAAVASLQLTPIDGQGPWAGLGVFWAWAGALLVLGTVLFERRDA